MTLEPSMGLAIVVCVVGVLAVMWWYGRKHDGF